MLMTGPTKNDERELLGCLVQRRLKLRCDRSIPCSSCVKRGCGAICPDGSLTTGQGNRFVLASTQELHEKISDLANRVRELEDALRSSHSRLSSDPHPLLSDELLRIKAPLQREPPSTRNADNSSQKEEENNPDVVDAFGSLSLSLSGGAKYYGQTANSWYFLQNEDGDDDGYEDHMLNLQNILSPEILARAASFPISAVPHPLHEGSTSIQNLFWYLPPADKAAELRSIYYTNAAWMYNPIPQESFDFEVYHQFYDTSNLPSADDPLLPHRLSLMFMILAIGTLMDTSLPAYNIEAEKYHQLARAALFRDSFVDSPTINAVQALYLMTFYLFLSDRNGAGSGSRWALMGMAVKVAQSIGLHRDSGRWKGIDPHETQRRRELFWEMFTYDSWQCLTYGRPTSFASAHFDCKMPHGNDPPDEQSYHAWKHRFSSECMNLLHDQAFGAKTPTYATILQLDRKLRAFPVPPVLQVAGFGSSEPRPGGFPQTIMLTLQRHVVLAIREMNLLYLHRSFFARAISDHPKDPLGSPYGTSVIAAYRSAGSLVALMRNLHTQLQEPSERIWFLWGHMFSCAIVLGSIVTRCPSMSLAPSALVQLDSACELFSKAARGFRAGKVLAIMLRLQEKAHMSLDDFRKGKGSPIGRYSVQDPQSPVDEDDELAMLGGKSRLVKKEPSSPALLDRSPNSHAPVVPLPLAPTADMDSNMLAYLGSFGTNHQPEPMSSTSSHTSFSDTDISPVSMYGMSTLPSTSTFQSDPSFLSQSQSMLQNHHQQQQTSPLSHATHRQNSSISNGHSQTLNGFPQYFPVYDYGMENGIDGYGSVPMLESNPRPAQRRSSSRSPEANTLHTTWNDFVEMAMN
ncbi:fungal-specific transcription factor domain-containing protein [Desarmillaria ectypa]|nr:fungal-specific transcription factor domain-containing protein [Desarmillaria ectypa]